MAEAAGSDGARIRWEELSSGEVASLDRDRAVLVLPLGAVEQHGPHMPVGTDTFLAHTVAIAAARQAGDVVVLPPPWYGFSAHHMRFPGTVTLRPETLAALAEDIVDSVIAHGFRRLVIVNGHGGNAGVVDVLAAKLGHRHYGKARIAALTYFQLADEAIARLRKSRPGGTGHAGEFETAMMMHVRPDLVHAEDAAATYPDPGSSYLTTDLQGRSPIRTYHDFGDLSRDGVLGDPTLAGPEAGERFFVAVVEALANFIADFRTWKVPKGDS